MTRSLLPALALALVLGACDANAPSDPATAAPAPSAASKSGDLIHHISALTGVSAAERSVVLHVEGQAFRIPAGEAYLLGQTMSRAAYDVMDEKAAGVIRPPKGGDRCVPSGGSGATASGGVATDKCPPPPLPPRFSVEELHVLLHDSFERGVEILEVPEYADWQPIAGGFYASF